MQFICWIREVQNVFQCECAWCEQAFRRSHSFRGVNSSRRLSDHKSKEISTYLDWWYASNQTGIASARNLLTKQVSCSSVSLWACVHCHVHWVICCRTQNGFPSPSCHSFFPHLPKVLVSMFSYWFCCIWIQVSTHLSKAEKKKKKESSFMTQCPSILL